MHPNFTSIRSTGFNISQRTTLRALIIGSLGFFAGLQGVSAAETFSAGSPPTSAPMTFLDQKTNTIEGVMPDVIREIGKREGFAVTFDAIPFAALIQSAVTGKIDIIVSAMTPTPKRAEVVDFADVVYSFGEGLVIPAGDKTKYKSAQDLKGEVIGAPMGTTYGEQLKQLGIFKEVKYYDNAGNMLTDLQNGRINAFFDDYPLLKSMASRGGLGTAHVDDDYQPLVVSGVAIAVRKGNAALLAKINDGVSKMKADGTMTAILNKWHLH